MNKLIDEPYLIRNTSTAPNTSINSNQLEKEITTALIPLKQFYLANLPSFLANSYRKKRGKKKITPNNINNNNIKLLKNNNKNVIHWLGHHNHCQSRPQNRHP